MKQHTQPCRECPWRRKSVPKFLGGFEATQWTALANSDDFVLCHVTNKHEDETKDPQCAGSSIYRANTCKLSRNPDVLRLPTDRDTVFSFRTEFEAHHSD